MSFNLIVEEAIKQTGLEYYEHTYKYTTIELTKLAATTLALHYKYGLGIAIAPRVHRALHKQYGSTVTPEQYKAFKKEYNTPVNLKMDTNRNTNN